MSEPSRPEVLEGPVLDRRAFLSSVGMTAGAAIAATILPLSVAGGAEANIAAVADAGGLWSVDIMCGHWPPYSHPIPYGRMEASEHALASTDHAPSLDQMLVA